MPLHPWYCTTQFYQLPSTATMGSIELPIHVKANFPPEANSEEYAQALDAKSPLKHLRHDFIIPTKKSLKTKTVTRHDESLDQSIYFCGNSLGLQPKATREFLDAHLNTWGAIGVNGHFTDLEESPVTQWQSYAEHAAALSAPIVGAKAEEVAVMGSLTMNLHLLMASFYKPTATRHKIILEWKAFPSDHYMFESQIRWHGLNPKEEMIMIGPEIEQGDYVITTEAVLALIDQNAEETALLLLPGIQYYSGQYFDMKTITAYAQARGIVVGWDLAHAAGNVPVQLHDWNVDFAAWCTYKYMNAGPGAIGGLFVHAKHGYVDYSAGPDSPSFVDRLSGWYGGDKNSRFNMDNKFKPLPGAGGWQLSNPSVVDIASLTSSLATFQKTSMAAIREKSLHITAYLEHLLLTDAPEGEPYRIISPSDPEQRGAQLSILLKPGLLPPVFKKLSDDGFVFDQRKPDVIRIAPAPLYNSYWEVYVFVREFKAALVAEATK